MSLHPSAPLLVAITDAVRTLEGSDSISHLWTLFSRCKGSLRDGGRLENISWRIWYHQLCPDAKHPLRDTPTLSSHSGSSSRTSLSDADFTAALPSGYRSPPPSSMGSATMSSPTTTTLTTTRRRYTTRSACTAPKAPVGQIICDIVPGKPFLPRKHADTLKSVITKSVPDSGLSRTKPPEDTTTNINSISTTTASTANLCPPPSISTPLLCVPQSPPPTSPFVIVQKPTPNPTPHPTPPATPVLPIQSTSSTSNASLHLVPPLPPLALAPISRVRPPRPPTASSPRESIDATLKPSDRRSFLGQSLEDGDSPEFEGSEGGKTSSVDMAEGSSGGSSQAQARSQGQGLSSPTRRRSVVIARTGTSANSRTSVNAKTNSSAKGKDAVRGPSRVGGANTHRVGARSGIVGGHRKAESLHVGKSGPMFNVGSVSSSGSKSRTSSASRKAPREVVGHVRSPMKDRAAPSNVTAKTPNAVAPNVAKSPPRRKIVIATTSSEYETTDTDDSWESEEDEDVEDEEDGRREGVSTQEMQLREAALEAQRQREMFAKVPARTYSLANRRTQSGLLSTLMNPDPRIFPPNHPYRVSRSSQDLASQVGSRPALIRMQSTGGGGGGVASPLAAQMTVVTARAPAPLLGTEEQQQQQQGGTSNGSVGYRPRGRPQGQEMEDSDSAEEGVENEIQVSRSIAQQKLAALAGRRDEQRGLGVSTATPTVTATTGGGTGATGGGRRSSDQGPMQQARVRPMLTSVATAPIPMVHPYNLPAPAPPMTPKTTRRQMLSTELSESLRRNLLWERQVSKLNVLGGGARRRPLTSGGDDLVERRREALSRNFSWDDDFHSSGW